MKTTAILLELGQTRVFISPKITEKRDREREREKKGLAQSLVFSVDFREDAYLLGYSSHTTVLKYNALYNHMSINL